MFPNKKNCMKKYTVMAIGHKDLANVTTCLAVRGSLSFIIFSPTITGTG